MARSATMFLAIFLALACGAEGPRADAKVSTEPFLPVLPDEALYPQGRYLYQRNCATCHGVYGDGKGDMAREMFPKPRPFTAGVFKFRSTPQGMLPTNDDLARTIRQGISGASMPVFAALSDREVRAVTEYIKSFSPKWKRKENYAAPLDLPEVPAWFDNSAELARRALKSRTLFTTACASCHGASGDGNGPAAASLKDDWDQPCRPPDLREPILRSGPGPIDAYRALTTGIAGTPMPTFAETLTDEQRWELVAFIEKARREFATKR